MGRGAETVKIKNTGRRWDGSRGEFVKSLSIVLNSGPVRLT